MRRDITTTPLRAGPLALPQTGATGTSLIQLAAMPNFALNPNLPEIANAVQQKNAALVANVGTLDGTNHKGAVPAAGTSLPTNLFSHPDQQLEWQNAAQSGATQTGWAGRIADTLKTSYNPGAQVPMITSVAGDTLFCNGSGEHAGECKPGQSGRSCVLGGNDGVRRAAGDGAGAAAVRLGLDAGAGGQCDHQQRVQLRQGADRGDCIGRRHLKTVFPDQNGLAAQLQQIAQIIQVRAALGVSRQIFFCGVGNFDTHSNQLALQNALLAQISPALDAFYNATVEMGVQNNVTSFTMSDFSRTFQPNSNTGSDHAWGSHHIVMGGAVKGGKMYGTFPTLALGGPDDSGSNGRWVPSTGSVQYAATLAQWFGVSAAQLPLVFPNIGNFKTTNLGFV